MEPPAVQHTINGFRITLEGNVLNIVEPDGGLSTMSIPLLVALQMYTNAPNVQRILEDQDAAHQCQLYQNRQQDYDIVPTCEADARTL